MLRQATALGLLLIAALNVSLPQAAEDCDDRRQVLREKIKAAHQLGNESVVDGLHQAQSQVNAYCHNLSLHRQRLDGVEQARSEVEERKLDLRIALGKGDPKKIAKRQATLAEARAKQQQAEARLDQ